MVRIEVDISGLQRKINGIVQGLQAPDDLMADLAETLFNEVKANFAAQGRPAWTPLKESTVASKKRRGVQSGIGKDSGDMFRSIQPSHSGNTATVGTANPYAGFFNDGTSKMAARAFMVLPDSGVRALEDSVATYIEMLANR
jgi:phage gpG-like protein